MSHPFFYLGFALLLVHEMDAVRLGAGYVAFAALHVPIYALLSAGSLGMAPRAAR
jgi:hypothetical protein